MKRILKVKDKTHQVPQETDSFCGYAIWSALKCWLTFRKPWKHACANTAYGWWKKQAQNSLTLEVCGKLKSSQTTISPGLEIRSKWPLPSGLKCLFYCCLIYFKECRRLSSSRQKYRKSVPVTESTKEVS